MGLALSLCPLTAVAQESSSSFNALKLPTSSHVSAVGGQNVSMVDDDATLGWTNPALYANVSDRSLALSFMTYAASTTWMGAHFVKAFGERHTLAVGANLMNYGKMDETDEQGNTSGTFSAKEFVLGVGYSYLLSDRWTGGANAKYLVSNLADYSAMAILVDVGLNYFNEESDFSLSASLQNIGTQVKAYDNGLRTHLPFNLALGISKGMAHLPVRIHVTLSDLMRWKQSYYVMPQQKDENKSDKVSFSKIALNHVVVGLDIQPSDIFYLSLGYNFRRAYELKAAGSSHWAGLTAGGGINVRRFQFGLSYAQYHQASSSLMVNAGYKF